MNVHSLIHRLKTCFYLRVALEKVLFPSFIIDGCFKNKANYYAAQLRQPKEYSLVLCHLKTLRLYTGLFKFEFDHYLTNVERIKSTYWG